MRFIKITSFFIVISIMLLFCYTIVNAIYYKGVPFTWQLKGYYVADSSYCGGKYYQVNDTLRVIAHESLARYKYYLYIHEDGKWIKTNIYTYSTTHEKMSDVLDYIRGKYDSYLRMDKRYKCWYE